MAGNDVADSLSYDLLKLRQIPVKVKLFIDKFIYLGPFLFIFIVFYLLEKFNSINYKSILRVTI